MYNEVYRTGLLGPDNQCVDYVLKTQSIHSLARCRLFHARLCWRCCGLIDAEIFMRPTVFVPKSAVFGMWLEDGLANRG